MQTRKGEGRIHPRVEIRGTLRPNYVGKLRDKVFLAQDIAKELVSVPEWGVEIEVRTMTALERSALLGAAYDENGRPDLTRIYPELLIAACYDPQSGEKVFEPADRDALNGKSGAALERVAQVAVRLAGLSRQAIEVAEKN